MIELVADLHTHTLCATHAYNTLSEMAAAAAEQGYRAIAVTDHGPAMPDAPHIWHFGNLRALPRTVCGVVILRGTEANVMDVNGGLDFSQSELAGLDWVVASIHSPCLAGTLTEREATRLWLAVAENPYVDCIGHSEQQNYRYDYDLVTRAFAKNQKTVELNGASFVVRPDGIANMRTLLAACLKNGCSVALDSDAHSAAQLGQSTPRFAELLAELHFPAELVVNASCKNLVAALAAHHKTCATEIGGILL